MPNPYPAVIPPPSERSFRVSRGDLIRIVDLKGQQVADPWAFATEPELEWLSTSQTRDITERLFPAVGDCFYGQSAEPMLTLVEDGSPGPHDMLFPACDRALYERAGLPGHPNSGTICSPRPAQRACRFLSFQIRSTSSRTRRHSRTAVWKSSRRSTRRAAM